VTREDNKHIAMANFDVIMHSQLDNENGQDRMRNSN